MEVKGDQYGNIQNSDLIINQGGMSATLTGSTREALLALTALQAHVKAASSNGVLDQETAQAASGELVAVSRKLASGGGADAISGLERTRRILGTAAGVAPLLETISNIIALIHGSAGN